MNIDHRLPLTCIDLFCGAGGLTEGLRQSGFQSVLGSDIDAEAMLTYARNHTDSWAIAAPIEKLDPDELRNSLGIQPGDLDLIAGGPPCQGFSINAPYRHLQDPRNALVMHFLRFVESFLPKTVLIENVPGMLSLAGGQVVDDIENKLREFGYLTSKKVLFAAHYGVPQERWRLIVLGTRVGEELQHPRPTHLASGRANFTGSRTLTFPTSEQFKGILVPPVTVFQAMDDLPALGSGEGCEVREYDCEPHSDYSRAMRVNSLLLSHHVAPKLSSINLERLKHIAPGGSWRDIPVDLLPEGMKKARRSDHTRRYGRLDPNGLSGTVMTKMDPHWGPAFHYSQDRALTVREAARLQSFPDTYQFTGTKVSQYRQVGNAVPVMMARSIGDQIAQHIISAVRANQEPIQRSFVVHFESQTDAIQIS